MLPADLSQHLHTEECNFLVKLWRDCEKEKSLFSIKFSYFFKFKFFKIIGRLVFHDCEDWMIAAGHCLKQERLYRRFFLFEVNLNVTFRETNPKHGDGKRLLENRRLPEERYTPTLKRLKAEGKLNFDSESSGCCSV